MQISTSATNNSLVAAASIEQSVRSLERLTKALRNTSRTGAAHDYRELINAGVGTLSRDLALDALKLLLSDVNTSNDAYTQIIQRVVLRPVDTALAAGTFPEDGDLGRAYWDWLGKVAPQLDTAIIGARDLVTVLRSRCV